MNYNLLSIIIPCYNGEKYIEKCLNSIMMQSYRNLDILVIDDGSTDNSFNICKNIAKKDSRIRVVRQENKGLPATRKIGIDMVVGEYITFVDVDDWIHPDMYLNMMYAMIKENVDIVQCGVCDTYPNGILKHRYQEEYNKTYEKYDRVTGFIKLIEEKEWRSYFWNKIYRKSLFDNIKFPVGRGLDEDTSVMHQIFHKAQSSLYFKDEYYYYYHHSNSICNNNDIKSITKQYYDRINARLERYQFVLQYPEYNVILPYLKSMTLSMCIAGLRQVIKYPSYFPKNYYKQLSIQISSIPIKKSEIDKEWISAYKRLEILCLKFSPLVYRFIILFIYKAI